MTTLTVEFQKLHNNQSTTFTAGHAAHNTALKVKLSHIWASCHSNDMKPYLGQGHKWNVYVEGLGRSSSLALCIYPTSLRTVIKLSAPAQKWVHALSQGKLCSYKAMEFFGIYFVSASFSQLNGNKQCHLKCSQSSTKDQWTIAVNSLIHTNSSLHNQEVAQFHFKVSKTLCRAEMRHSIPHYNAVWPVPNGAIHCEFSQ